MLRAMDLDALTTDKHARLAPILAAGRAATGDTDPKVLLQVALANEINVSELAAAWMPTTPEIDVKIALAKQAGDEAGHFELVAGRLATLGYDLAAFAPPPDNSQFQYLRGLATTVERLAALWTLESLAVGVNENFMAYCEARGDRETVQIYRDFIQPDEHAHEVACGLLLAKYATTPAETAAAATVVATVLELAETNRARAAVRVGTSCLPGC